jgi:hypothetical protein
MSLIQRYVDLITCTAYKTSSKSVVEEENFFFPDHIAHNNQVDYHGV